MRFLLINPYSPTSETPSPPLGLAYLAAALEQAGIEVKLLDLVVLPYTNKILASVLQEFSTDFGGAAAVARARRSPPPACGRRCSISMRSLCRLGPSSLWAGTGPCICRSA